MSARYTSKYAEYDSRLARQSAEGAVMVAVDRAPDYYAGEIESLHAKLNKVTNILASVVGALPLDVQRQVMDSLGFKETP